jgi:hypothetical protein
MTEKTKAHISHQAMNVSTPTMKLHVSQVFAKSADGYPFYAVVPSTLVDSFWFDKLTPVKEMVRLTDSKLARERFHVLSVGYNLHFTTNDPPVLIAEDLEIYRIWVAEKVLPGSLGPLGGNAAGLIERH